MPEPAKKPPDAETSVRETLISLLISFVMALVFRSYVVEAFIIPTGSMAPTLLGAHMRFQSSQTGHSWAVNPWYYANQDTPYSIQGQGQYGAPSSTDPMTTSRPNSFRPGGRPTSGSGYLTPTRPMPLSAGDRILVQKYLYNIFPPKRFDVVVFKNPEMATQNFIKRLVGLPGEQVWLADGDVFTRPYEKDASGKETFGAWRVQRKPHRIQESLWRPVFSSEFTPLNPEADGRRWFNTPWSGDQWQTSERRSYRCDTEQPTQLSWDGGQWPITDWVPYNDFPDKVLGPMDLFPVPDVRLRAGVQPDRAGLTAIASVRVHGHEYQGVLAAGNAVLRMRRVAPSAAEPLPWTDLKTASFAGFDPGDVTNVEFWHVDQALELRVNGSTLVRSEEIPWGPSERLLHATGTKGEDFTETGFNTNRLRAAETYAFSSPEIAWTFQGSPLTLHRVGLDRDIYYEPANFRSGGGGPALATHPANLATLGPDQFFMLGDNSPSSKDGRLWDMIDPWVADQMDPTRGVVPRDLILGKAFFVYFPSPYSALGRIPVPDLGRIRFIQ